MHFIEANPPSNIEKGANLAGLKCRFPQSPPRYLAIDKRAESRHRLSWACPFIHCSRLAARPDLAEDAQEGSNLPSAMPAGQEGQLLRHPPERAAGQREVLQHCLSASERPQTIFEPAHMPSSLNQKKGANPDALKPALRCIH